MNKERRKRIEDVVSSLGELQTELCYILEEENEAIENMPENLQYSDKVERMRDKADDIDTAISDIDSLINDLNDIIDD